MSGSQVTVVRIVSPASRAREVASPEDLRVGDVFEIVDKPVYQVDPRTYKCTTTLQQFEMRDGGQMDIKGAA